MFDDLRTCECGRTYNDSVVEDGCPTCTAGDHDLASDGGRAQTTLGECPVCEVERRLVYQGSLEHVAVWECTVCQASLGEHRDLAAFHRLRDPAPDAPECQVEGCTGRVTAGGDRSQCGIHDVIARARDGDGPPVMTDGGLVTACPECDSSNISSRVQDDYFAGEQLSSAWYCDACGSRFDEPIEREPKSDAGETGLARTLVEADPDDLATDGGVATVRLSPDEAAALKHYVAENASQRLRENRVGGSAPLVERLAVAAGAKKPDADLRAVSDGGRTKGESQADQRRFTVDGLRFCIAPSGHSEVDASDVFRRLRVRGAIDDGVGVENAVLVPEGDDRDDAHAAAVDADLGDVADGDRLHVRLLPPDAQPGYPALVGTGSAERRAELEGSR